MAESKTSGLSCTKSTIIVVFLIILIFGLGVFCIWKISGPCWPFDGSKKSTKIISTRVEDKNIIGTWQSSCLVANAENNSYEKYQFDIKDDGTAVYTKTTSSNKDCTEGKPEKIDYRYSILKNNKINLRDITNKKTIYDIYNITGTKLQFGQGYRGSYGESTKKGDCSASRYDSLNEYIIYEKM